MGKGFRHRPGTVDAEQEERQAARPGTPQRRQPVRHLFEAAPETRLQQFDVIAGRLAGGEKAAIGHQHGGGGIFAQRHQSRTPVQRVSNAGPGDGIGDHRLELDQRQLDGGGEPA